MYQCKMYNFGMSEQVEMEVRYRANGQCECRSEKHRFYPNNRCPNSVIDTVRARFVWPKNRMPIARNVRLICYHCYLFCASGRKRRLIKPRRFA